ncbi:hypothetical protein [Streptomyces albus]|uniref:hypothetical protein n=1 Tax=Streptomyces albus TaxID=1888 RepID=UPI00340CBC11
MNELEKAQKAAEAAQKALAEAEAKEAARQAEIAAQRRKRESEYAENFLSRWQELAQDAAQVDQASNEYDPKTMGFLEGVIRFAAAREKRAAVLTAAQQAEHTLGVPSNRTTVPESRPYALNITQHIEAIIKAEVSRRVGEFTDKLEAEREKFVNGS